MRRTVLLVAIALLPSACLAAFAPSILARREHAGMRRTSPSHECLACHPKETAATTHALPRGDPPIVAAWMTADTRGCLGCHAVLGAK
jgi:hypothetical protein